MNEELLLPFFSEFGPVAELTVIRDKVNQTHKGNAYSFLLSYDLKESTLSQILIFYFVFLCSGCAFLTYCMQQSARRAVDQLHDKIKLPNVSNI